MAANALLPPRAAWPHVARGVAPVFLMHIHVPYVRTMYVPISRFISVGHYYVYCCIRRDAMAAEAAAAAFPFGTVVVTSPSFVGGSSTSCTRTSSTRTCSSTSASARRRRVGPLAHLAGTLPPHVRVLGTSDPHGGEF